MKFYARNQVMMRLVASRDAIAIARMIRSLQFHEPCGSRSKHLRAFEGDQVWSRSLRKTGQVIAGRACCAKMSDYTVNADLADVVVQAFEYLVSAGLDAAQIKKLSKDGKIKFAHYLGATYG